MQSIDAGMPIRFRRQVRFHAEKYQGNSLIFAAGFRRQKGHRGKGKFPESTGFIFVDCDIIHVLRGITLIGGAGLSQYADRPALLVISERIRK